MLEAVAEADSEMVAVTEAETEIVGVFELVSEIVGVTVLVVVTVAEKEKEIKKRKSEIEKRYWSIDCIELEVEMSHE